MTGTRLVRIEWARLPGERPREVGANACRGAHGAKISVPVARVTTGDGVSGFGWSQISRDKAQDLVGGSLAEAFGEERGVEDRFSELELPLWDLAGRRAGRPVYALVGGEVQQGGFRVPCYDTSLYFDGLHLDSDEEAAALIASEAQEGMAGGHRAFKIKVGRGAMHMPVEKGTRRDVLVVRAVREAVGPEATILLDANNGYNLDLARRVLRETADARVHWLEEPFRENASLNKHLKDWLRAEGLDVLVADGEGDASPRLLDLARKGLIDVVQYDLRGYRFTRWRELGPTLDAWNVRSAPHNYGQLLGNHCSCHLAGCIARYAFAEWDEAVAPGLDASAYSISDGCVNVPALPGFGLGLDEDVYARAIEQDGFVVESR